MSQRREGHEEDIRDYEEEENAEERVEFSEGDKKLFVACENLNVEEVRTLLETGEADASHEYDEEGTWGAHERSSAVHKVLRHCVEDTDLDAVGSLVVQVLRLLLSHGASLSARMESYDWRGCGSSESGIDMILEDGDADLLRLAIENGAFDPNQPTVSDAHTMRYDGRRVGFPLHAAVEKGDLEMVRLLIQAGAKVDARRTSRGQSEYGKADDTSETALHVAVATTEEAVVRALLEGGADPNALRKWVDNVSVEVESDVTDPREEGYE